MTIIVLLVILLLRIPSFFEPYWYGDEGIYLAIGQALQRGAVLYRDIWDNKTPLLYLIYGLHPTLLWAKISATLCVLGICFFVKKISKSNLAALVCGVFLSLPLLEGIIANAELYFTLPIVIATYLLLRHSGRAQSLLIGLCLTIAFLIKVPAVFDFLGLFLAWFIINRKIKPFFIISVPFSITFCFLLSYFYFNNALGDFLIASFSQNASYVAIDSGPFSKLSNPLFIKGIILVASCFLLSTFYFRKKITKELLILSVWFGFSLYGALLSNRPYPHYLLQIVPPSVILIYYLIENYKKYYLFFMPLASIFYILYSIFKAGFALPTLGYYQNFGEYITGNKSWENYANWFDPHTIANYKIANYLSGDNLFMWGDNVFVYVLSDIAPTTKFIQAHHLTTINPKNYDDIIAQINFKKPGFIIVIRPVKFPFPKLEELITNNYKLVKVIGENYLYQILGNIPNKPANPILGTRAIK